MATHARMTAQDLQCLGEGDLRRELVNGRIIEMPPHGGMHGHIASKIHRLLADHVERAGGGELLVGDVGFILNLASDPERVRAPDIAFISASRLPERRVPEGFLTGAPDLAVEVLSPSDDPVDIQQKVRDYLDAGARLVWLVAPQVKTVTVYRSDGSARLLRDQDILEGEDVLPGFSIPLAAVLPS